MIRLTVRVKERVIHFPLRDDIPEATAGSLPDNAIYLPYKGISRRHFTLRKKDSGWWLIDLGSTNGTLLNGSRVTESIIRVGDIIQAGVVRLDVEASSKEGEPIILRQTTGRPDHERTERVSSLEADSHENIFSFPKLVLTEGMILSSSPAMVEIYEKLHTIVDSDVNVLFVGETGTGKEMLARTVHLSSNRSQGPFIAVNCAAIPADLVEAELFGIGERVATNVSRRAGKLAAASGGTLFLDELEAFPLALQAKVLRAFEEKEVTPVGEHRSIPVDFRLLSATNQEPEELIRNQKLREDLYHRLATLEIHIPPLRERGSDLEELIPGVLQQIAKKENKTLGGISRRLMDLLLKYSYPGNLRELTNILRATVALSHPGEILDTHLVPEKLFGSSPSSAGDDAIANMFREGKVHLKTAVDDYTSRIIRHALQIHEGNIRRAAERLDITPFGLRKMMKRLNIDG